MSTDLGRAILCEAETGAVLGEAKELIEWPVRQAPRKATATLDGERRGERPPGAALRSGRSGERRVRGPGHRRGAELLVDERPVRQADAGAGVRAGRPVDVIVAVERRRATAAGRCSLPVGRRGRLEGIRCRGGGGWVRVVSVCGGVGLEADLDAGEEEPPVRGDKGVSRVHGHVAGPAEQRAVLHAEEVGVGLLESRRRREVAVS